MKKTKYILILLLVVLCHNAIAQIDNREILIQKIHQECSFIFSKQPSLCKAVNYDDLREKFNAAEIYLTDKLSKLILVDSSTFYDKEKEALENLEKHQPQNKKDALIWENKREKSYLLLSALKPLKSHRLFSKLLHGYIQTNSFSNPDIKHLESFFYYKLWLYDLLENRFEKQTTSFSESKAIMNYNKAISLCQHEFVDIDSEHELVNQMEIFAKRATADNLLDKNYKDFMNKLYIVRADKANRKHSANRNKALFDFTESLYLKAWELKPDSYESNINFGLL